jgi:hypothetical protein
MARVVDFRLVVWPLGFVPLLLVCGLCFLLLFRFSSSSFFFVLELGAP